MLVVHIMLEGSSNTNFCERFCQKRQSPILAILTNTPMSPIFLHWTLAWWEAYCKCSMEEQGTHPSCCPLPPSSYTIKPWSQWGYCAEKKLTKYTPFPSLVPIVALQGMDRQELSSDTKDLDVCSWLFYSSDCSSNTQRKPKVRKRRCNRKSHQ